MAKAGKSVFWPLSFNVHRAFRWISAMVLIPAVKFSWALAVAAAKIILFGITFARKMFPCTFSTDRIRMIAIVKRMIERLTFPTTRNVRINWPTFKVAKAKSVTEINWDVVMQFSCEENCCSISRSVLNTRFGIKQFQGPSIVPFQVKVRIPPR